MKNPPLVSVVTAFLNQESFIRETIESVLRQNYEHWEILLIDDGSVDGSSTIAKEFAAACPEKIFYFDHEGHLNKGVCASRNLGLKKAKGDIIAILDADDVWLPFFLTNQVELMLKHNVAMVCEASKYWYTWTEGVQRRDVIKPVGAQQDRLFHPPQLLLDLYPLTKGAAPCPCGLLIKKEVLVKHGGFDETFTGMFQFYEDQVYLSKIYLTETVFISSVCNNLYRQRPNSLVATSKEKDSYHLARNRFLNWLEQYLKQYQIDKSEINKLLKKALFQYRNPKTYFLLKKLPHKILRRVKMLVPSFI